MSDQQPSDKHENHGSSDGPVQPENHSAHKDHNGMEQSGRESSADHEDHKGGGHHARMVIDLVVDFKRLGLLLLAVVYDPFLCGLSVAQTRGYGDWHMGPGMTGWGMGWFGGILMVIIAVLVIIGVVYLVRWVASSTSAEKTPPSPSAMDILKERYARGEIDKEEFEEKKRDLSR